MMIDTEQDLVVRVLTGEIEIDEIIASLDNMTEHPGYHAGMKSLNDLREFVPTSSASNVRLMADYLLSNPLEQGVRAAVVVSRSVDYGMTRMLQALADSPAFSIGAFYDIDEAKEWLGVR